ncbi:MAG: sigma-70 family RNA polymerase sigma factor [FCB group bacterium]|nr:sigma-70 family RNA polymerase sigma factor [FCB group bacterium]
MGRERIIYQNWIVELDYDPALGRPWEDVASGYSEKVISAVNQVLDNLDPAEALFIRRFYFQGMSYRKISRLTGRAIHRLETLHNGAIRKLKIRLPAILDLPEPVALSTNSDCPLCNHPESEEINRLICSKGSEETWRRIIKVLKETYGLVICSPQRLIGHQKYHIS